MVARTAVGAATVSNPWISKRRIGKSGNATWRRFGCRNEARARNVHTLVYGIFGKNLEVKGAMDLGEEGLGAVILRCVP